MTIHRIDGDGTFTAIDLAAIRAARCHGRTVEVLIDTTWVVVREVLESGHHNPETEAYDAYASLVHAWERR